jgi:hypothetical protein
MAQQLSSLVQNTLAVDVTNITGTIPVAKGGTNATTAASALTNLGAEASANKGAANGYVPLDGSTKISSTYLPSYVDDVLEYANLAALPATGETAKIYVTLDTNKTYRWSGSAYVEISASPGSTDAVTEGSTNLYFTNTRARAAISATQNVTYNSSTGVITGPVLSGYLTSYTETDTLATVTARGATTTVVPTFSSGTVIQGMTVGRGANAVANNIAVGISALPNASLSGGYNIAVGSYALFVNTTGLNNTAIGAGSTQANIAGNNNVGIGLNSLYNNTGSNNIAIGTYAGPNLTTGSNNTIIGSVAGTAGLSDTVIIAAGTNERMRIGSSGNVGIGGTAPAGFSVASLKNITGAVNSYGFALSASVSSDVTSAVYGFNSYIVTQAAAFNLSSLVHFNASGDIGAGSSITNQYGYLVSSGLTGATYNYGFYGAIAAGTNRYNLYMAGTAANYLGGALSVAGKVTTLAQVETPDVTSLLTTANTYPTSRPSLNLDFANSATLDPRVTFTRGTNATYTGSDGLIKNTSTINSPRFDWDPVTRECKGLLIEEARTNLLAYSNNFDIAGFSLTGAYWKPNSILSPSGANNATTIVNTAGTVSLYQSWDTTVPASSTNDYYVSIYVKRGNTPAVTFNCYYTYNNEDNVTFNFDTLAVSGVPYTGEYIFTNVGNGWYRIGYRITRDSTGTRTIILHRLWGSSRGTGVIGDTVSIWGAQLEAGAFATSYIPSSVTWTGRASTATYVGSNGLIQTAASGVARYQYNPTNLSVAPFLLLEPAATNLYPYGTAALVNTASPNTLAASTEISALMTGSLITKSTRDTGTGDSNIGYFATSLLATTVYVGSMYIWIPAATTITGLALTMDGATSPVSLSADLTIRNQWQRIYVTATTASATAYATVLGASGMVTGGYVYSTCYQIETGTYPTSYIPTAASQVTRIADTSTSAQTTRSADVATMTGTNFSSWYNQTEGTFVVNAKRNSLGGGSYPGVFYVDNGYSGTSLGVVFLDTPGTLLYEAYVDNVNVMGGVVASSVLANTFYKVSVGYKLNNAAGVANTGTLQTSSPTSLPIVNRLIIGLLRGGGSPLNGTIAKLTYYPVRLSNSTLQALTT